MGVRKTDGEIERMKEEIRELLFEKGFVRSDWYDVVWGILVDDYMENEVGEWETWKELIWAVKKNMERELSRRLGV